MKKESKRVKQWKSKMKRKLRQLKLSKKMKEEINKQRRLRYAIRNAFSEIPIPLELRKSALNRIVKALQKGGKSHGNKLHQSSGNKSKLA
jgi:hypothetical protein